MTRAEWGSEAAWNADAVSAARSPGFVNGFPEVALENSSVSAVTATVFQNRHLLGLRTSRHSHFDWRGARGYRCWHSEHLLLQGHANSGVSYERRQGAVQLVEASR